MAGITSIFTAIAPVLGSLLGGGPSAPTPQAPPPAPAPAAPPPAPTVSTAPEVSGEEPVIDTEAAKVRAQKRRRAAEDEKLFTLSNSEEDSTSTALTKSLLGGP